MNKLDLDKYFERIGYGGGNAPELETLHALTKAHTTSIPFENIDVLLKNPILLEPEAIFRKMVLEKRGGYCFEHNGLFAAVLAQLGFTVHPLGARVRLLTPDRAITPTRTHLLLEVTINGEKWLTDVGFGGFSMTRALRFQADIIQKSEFDSRRIQKVGNTWFHQILRNDQWVDGYEFTDHEMPFIDQVVGNWYTSTNPDCHFTSELLVTQVKADGSLYLLKNNRFTIRKNNAEQSNDLLETELMAVLQNDFGIELPAGSHIPIDFGMAH